MFYLAAQVIENVQGKDKNQVDSEDVSQVY